MNKPQRTRAHQLEREARLAFESIIPNEWMFVDISTNNDYGLDGRVEIFDQKGFASGAMFFVQLKGTDKALNKDNGVSIQLKVKTCNYYYSLDLPVLIVCYHAPTKQVFAKWFHLYDPYYGKDAEKEISFPFSTSDTWNEKTMLKLNLSLEAFRQIRSQNLTTPISCTLIHKAKRYNEISASRIELEIYNQIPPVSDLLKISRSHSSRDTHGEIVISSDKIETILFSGTGFTQHITEKGYFVQDNLSLIPNDIILSIAIGLHIAGHTAIPAQLMIESYLRSSLVVDSEIAVIISSCLCKAGFINRNLEIAENLLMFRQVESHEIARIFLFSARMYAESFTSTEHQYFQNVSQELITKIKQQNNNQELAVVCYNFGNYWASIDKYRLALHYYKKASQHWAEYYCKQPYFNCELAYILFRSKRYLLAAKLYHQSLDLGAEKEVQAFYADALLFAGRYYEATVAFVRYLESNPEADSKWRLKTIVAGCIYRMINGGSQKRETKLAYKGSGCDKSLSLEQNKENLLKVLLDKDALCQNAYFNLGLLEYSSGNLEKAFFPFVVASVIDEGDAESRCHAILAGILTKNLDIVYHLVVAGCTTFPGNFITKMIEFVEAQPEDFPTELVLEGFNQVVEQVPDKKKRFIIRDVKSQGKTDL